MSEAIDHPVARQLVKGANVYRARYRFPDSTVVMVVVPSWLLDEDDGLLLAAYNVRPLTYDLERELVGDSLSVTFAPMDPNLIGYDETLTVILVDG